MSKSAPPPEKENNERWVISYADLVTLLLGFFIILYATGKQDAEKFKLFAFGLSSAFSVGVADGQPGGNSVFEGGRGLLPGPINTGTIDRDLSLIQQAIEERSTRNGLSGQVIVTRQDDTIVIRLPNQL